uniref:hypothetical protein n=1 Tax=Microtetraspora fusca TaxID=1997 RepID=UPI00083010A4|nr:hypothetical protein [Microtetraspora fusca]
MLEFLRLREYGRLVIGLAGGQAVVDDAEHAVEQVGLRREVAVTVFSSAPVLGGRAWLGGQEAERPLVAV